MVHSLWFPVIVVFAAVIWLAALLSGLGKPRPRRRPRKDGDDSVVPFVWGGDDGDDGHHGLH